MRKPNLFAYRVVTLFALGAVQGTTLNLEASPIETLGFCGGNAQEQGTSTV